jgi:hypothetical protein
MAVGISFDHGHCLARSSQFPHPLEIPAQLGKRNFNPCGAKKFVSRKIH